MDHPDWLHGNLSTGTTIMAVEFDGGVIIGADSRTSVGSYIANRMSDKLTKVTDHIYCCRSGAAADTQAIADVVRYQLDLLTMELGEPASVKTGANAFRQLCYNYRESVSAGIICAGWDKRGGGQVYSIPVGGMIKRMPLALGGSGSTYVYGFADANFKPGMTRDACREFVVKAVTLAMARDGSSGGLIRIGVITEKGIERETITQESFPSYYED